MKALFLRTTVLAALFAAAPLTQAANYKIDPTHSFIEFRVQHLGYSWLYGRFNTITGKFSHDAAKPDANQVELTIDTTSVDSNHGKRDDHLRSDDFLNVAKFANASFKSTGYTGSAEAGTMTGELTLHGVTKPISIEVKKMGEGKDPWGGYRAGFEGSITLDRRDFGIEKSLGPKGWSVELDLGLEGIREK